MGGISKREARRGVKTSKTILAAELKMRRIMRHLEGSSRRRQPPRSGMQQPSAIKTFTVAGHQGRLQCRALGLTKP